MAKCSKCKTITTKAEMIVHQRTTHGIPFIYWKDADLDWDWINVLYNQHKETGKQGKFKDKFK